MNEKDVSVIKERFERVLWTYKTHEKAAERENLINVCLRLGNIVLLGISCAFVVDNKTLAGSIFIFISFCLALYNLGNNHSEKYHLHLESGKEFLAIKDAYISFLSDMKNRRMDEKEFMRRRDDLEKQFVTQCKRSPQTYPCDYKKASWALNNGKEGSSSEQEIDAFLPDALRKNRKL